MDHENIAKNTASLINGYPNTYTYTKNLAERYLERNRGNLRLVINRPTMIYGCVREPMPGWVDQVTPLGGVGLPLALGMARTFHFPNIVLDFIPGDIVTNQIIVTTAVATTSPQPEFRIFHNSMSGSNPFNVYDYWKSGVEYLKYNPYEQQIRDIGFWPIGDKKLYDTVIYL
jgi:alcohol-forming fatty acyl-CoA reductase